MSFRYKNILAFDHSRFKLSGDGTNIDGLDYINANYVPGFNNPKGFLSTQGPLESTVDDFWQMVWEAGSQGIVMLTRCGLTYLVLSLYFTIFGGVD